MAMNGGALGSQIKTAIEAAFGVELPESSGDAWDAIGNAIVAHIQANAQVVVASVSGVTTGGGVSGPGTGTIL